MRRHAPRPREHRSSKVRDEELLPSSAGRRRARPGRRRSRSIRAWTRVRVDVDVAPDRARRATSRRAAVDQNAPARGRRVLEGDERGVVAEAESRERSRRAVSFSSASAAWNPRAAVGALPHPPRAKTNRPPRRRRRRPLPGRVDAASFVRLRRGVRGGGGGGVQRRLHRSSPSFMLHRCLPPLERKRARARRRRGGRRRRRTREPGARLSETDAEEGGGGGRKRAMSFGSRGVADECFREKKKRSADPPRADVSVGDPDARGRANARCRPSSRRAPIAPSSEATNARCFVLDRRTRRGRRGPGIRCAGRKTRPVSCRTSTATGRRRARRQRSPAAAANTARGHEVGASWGDRSRRRACARARGDGARSRARQQDKTQPPALKRAAVRSLITIAPAPPKPRRRWRPPHKSSRGANRASRP